MGSSFGCTMLYNAKNVPISEIELTFQEVLAENSARLKERLSKFSLFEISGFPDGAMLYKPGSPWVSTLENATISGFDPSSIGPHASRYANAFGLPVMAVSVFDSDILLLAFCNPEALPVVFAATHNDIKEDPLLCEEYEITSEQLTFPEPLEQYATSEELSKLREIWQADVVCIEEIVFDIANILDFSVIHDQQEEIEGYIYTEI